MKKSSLIILLVVFTGLKSFGQWQLQSYPPMTIEESAFKSIDSGMAVGWLYNNSLDSGIVMRTYDRGVSWHRVFMQPAYFFKATSSKNDSILFAGGYHANPSDSSMIIRTSNWGNTWTKQKFAGIFRDIFFPNADTGYALIEATSFLAFQVYRTTNAGLSWQSVSTINSGGAYELFFTRGMIGYVAKDSGVSKTTDGGVTWTFTPLGIGQGKAISFPSADTGYVITDKNPFTLNDSMIIFRTLNAGGSWSRVYSLSSLDTFSGAQTQYPTDIDFPTNNIGWFVTDGGGYSEVRKTIDAGATWIREQNLPGGGGWWNDGTLGSTFLNKDTGYIFGGFGFWVTTTGGSYLSVNSTTNSTIQIYPNPVTEELTITNLSAKVAVQLLDITGRVLFNQTSPTSKLIIDMSAFPSGIYLLKTNEGVKKVVKM